MSFPLTLCEYLGHRW